MNIRNRIICLSLFFCIGINTYSEKREITPVVPKIIEPTETYEILEEYGFKTQTWPGEHAEGVLFKDVIRLSNSDSEVIWAYFVVDDGERCLLKKSWTNYGSVGYGSAMPQEIDITDKILCVISGYGEDVNDFDTDWDDDDIVLRQVLMLIDGPEKDENFGDIDLILMYTKDKGLFSVPVTIRELLPVEKGTVTINDLREKASEFAGEYTDWKWYIETFED